MAIPTEVLSFMGLHTALSDNVNLPNASQIFKSYEEAKDYDFLYALKIDFSIR